MDRREVDRREVKDRAARRRWFGRGRTRALLSAGMLVGIGAVATSAYWTDAEQVPGTTINSGTMHIDLAANFRQRPESYAWNAFVLTGLTPGTSKSAELPVTNNSRGGVTFSYRIQTSAPGALGAALEVSVYRGATSNGTTCTGGTLLGSANTPINTFDQAAGATLAPTSSHNLCVRVTLPLAAVVPPSSSSAITFTFPATQVNS